MPLQAIDSQRLYQQVAGQISGLIRQGEFRLGERLPSERDLARQLGVSRPIVREAMIALEIQGFVEVRTGSGSFVTRAPADGGAAPGADVGPSAFDLIAARKLLEPEIARQAALARSAADLATLRETLDAMGEAAAAGLDMAPSDRLFHSQVAAATGNSVLISTVEQFWDLAATPLFASLHGRSGLPANQMAALAEHGAILDALRAGDADASHAAMRSHLERTEAILSADDPAA
jgi:DNA-binding FadR family transcriptional regulator